MAVRRKPAPSPVDAYLAKLEPAQRDALERLRRQIHAAAPGATECLSYRMPAVRFEGRVLVWFAAQARHCAFYPGAVVQAFRRELAAFETRTGTVRFQPAHPIPAALVKKLVRARIRAVRADRKG